MLGLNAWPMRASNRLRQLGSGRMDLQQGYAAAIAQQAAVATAQSLLAWVNPAVGRAPEVNLPGFQQFQPGNREMPLNRRDDALRSMLDQAAVASAGNGASSNVPSTAAVPRQLALTNGEAGQVVSEILPSAAAAPAVPASSVPLAVPIDASQTTAAGAPAVPEPLASAVEVPPEGTTASGSADAVERSLAALANAHYDETLPSVVPLEDLPACKRPATKSALTVQKVMKKPASAAKVMASSGNKSFKKPAAAAAASKGSMKKPAAKAVDKKKITRKEAYELMPTGCGRCRYQRGCCPSCWKKKGIVLLD
eukprot:s4420_g4.t1